MASSASPFVIEELTGEKRKIELTGRALPYRPFTLSGDQRHNLSWYQGSPEGTMQIQGAKEDPTTINGWWKDRFIRTIVDLSQAEFDAAGFLTELDSVAGRAGIPPAQVDRIPVNVVELAEVCNSIRRQGQIVKVTWLHIVRTGLLSKFIEKWHTAQDLEWSITFAWINQGVQLADSPIQTRNVDLADATSQISDGIERIGEAFGIGTENPRLRDSSIKLSRSPFFKGFKEIDKAIFDIKLSALALEKTVTSNVKTVLSPITSIRRAAGIFNFIKLRAANIQKSLGKLVALFEAVNIAIFQGKLPSFGEGLADRVDVEEQRRSVAVILSLAATSQDQLEKQLEPELIDSFVAREDQDLRDVSTLHYGTPDSWQSLMRFNELATSKLTAGQLIFVPRNPPRGADC